MCPCLDGLESVFWLYCFLVWLKNEQLLFVEALTIWRIEVPWMLAFCKFRSRSDSSVDSTTRHLFCECIQLVYILHFSLLTRHNCIWHSTIYHPQNPKKPVALLCYCHCYSISRPMRSIHMRWINHFIIWCNKFNPICTASCSTDDSHSCYVTKLYFSDCAITNTIHFYYNSIFWYPR